MGLIKSTNLTDIPASAFSLLDIERRAEALVTRARAEADQVLAQARRDADGLRAKARAEGLAQGQAQGRQEGRAAGEAQGKQAALAEHKVKLADAIKAITSASQQLDARRASIESDARADLLKLAVLIARRVTRRLAETDPAVASEAVARAVATLQNKTRVGIVVNPAQKQLIEQMLPELKLAWPAMQHVELRADGAVKPGSCVVRSGSGEIDTDLDAQVDRIVELLVPRSAGDQ
jgi:flagellar assembly protein FliH